MHNVNVGRRNTIFKAIQGIGSIAFGGLLWSVYLSKTKASHLLRPPGALDEFDFIKSCIKCGLCVESCPFDTLKLARLEDDALIGTPYFVPRETPCYMCTDFPCVVACPTKALDDRLLTKDNDKSINNAKMGVAVLDSSNCIAYWGIQCDACYRACPLIDFAIKLEYRASHLGNHAHLLPIVDNDICTGCGICERVCITKKASITIISRDKIIGSTDKHYTQSSRDSDRYINVDKFNKDENPAMEYLNDGHTIND